MADNNGETLVLRERNAQLLGKLQMGVTSLKEAFDTVKRGQLQVSKDTDKKAVRAIPSLNSANVPTELIDTRNAFKGFSCTPLDSKESSYRGPSGRKRPTSTPKTYGEALSSAGNFRKSIQDERRTPMKSILLTPKDKRKRKKSQHVTFDRSQSGLENTNISNSKINGDKSLLGYDWIAGLLDNEDNQMDKSEAYLKDIQEFRRINRKECFSTVNSYTNFSGNVRQDVNESLSTTLNTTADGSGISYVCGRSFFTIDKRLKPIPIHGPGSHCPICKTKPESEKEYDNSYIRVSVPRSTLESPYRVRPHRRKSFDPSDSVALGEHCLAGWQCSWPATAPGLSALDLRSALQKEEQESSQVGDNARQKTKSLLDSSYSIQYDMLRQKKS